MNRMKSYIVRIYRQEEGKEKLFGTVERPGADVKLAFTNQDELWDILVRLPRKSSAADDEKAMKDRT